MVRTNTKRVRENIPKTVEYERNNGKVQLAHLKHFEYRGDRWDMYIVDPESLVRWDKPDIEYSKYTGNMRKHGYKSESIYREKLMYATRRS